MCVCAVTPGVDMYPEPGPQIHLFRLAFTRITRRLSSSHLGARYPWIVFFLHWTS